ncbi:MAG: nitronate monooxygenase [Deltaproteobacteria bacterium]|nr:nitronate monooxygenase [Deltaproteobacteria bacterium]
MKFPELRIGDLIAKVAIVQGGMGVGISLSGLASAVANEGGIGVISAAFPGMGEADISENSSEVNIRALRNEIRKAKQMTSGLLGVNIMVALTNFSEMVETSIEAGIDIIFAGAGLPMSLPGYLKEGSKTKLVPIVSSGRAAKLICKKWLSKYDYPPDAFVVEGPKAGGHLGFKAEQLDDPAFALEGLVKDVIEAVQPFEQERNVRIPVIAAGGIFTGRDIWKFLEMGAAGVQLGTRFVATHECDADEGFKQVYLDATAEDMAVIKSPLGLPGRVVRNRFIDEVEEGTKKPFRCVFKCLITCDPEKSPYCIALALANARKGKFTYGFAFAGKNAYRVQEIVSVKELMETLQKEYSEIA